jgi:hypothetical protein
VANLGNSADAVGLAGDVVFSTIGRTGEMSADALLDPEEAVVLRR